MKCVDITRKASQIEVWGGKIPKALFSDDVLRIASQNVDYYFEENIGFLVR